MSAFRMEQDQAAFKLTFVSLHLIKFSFQWEFQIALDLRIPKLTSMLSFDAVIMDKTMFVQILLTVTVTEALIK